MYFGQKKHIFVAVWDRIHNMKAVHVTPCARIQVQRQRGRFQQIHSLNISWRDVEKSRREGFEREQISQGALLITSWNEFF